MSGDVVNLRRVRKAKQRADRSSSADANRVLHGRTRAEREVATAERGRLSRVLEAHRLEGATDDDGAAS